MRRAGVGAFAVMAGLLLALAPNVGATSYEPEPPAFCGEPVLHDYFKPLERMPKVRFAGGALGFGPTKLQLWIGSENASGRSLVAPGGLLHYTLSLGGRTSVRLGWGLTAELTEVDARGRPTAGAATVRQSIPRLGGGKGAGHIFHDGDRPGFYRLTVELDNRHGRKLGEFGDLARVVRPSFVPRLETNRKLYSTGSTLFARIQNGGTESAFYGLGDTIERPGPLGWERVPGLPVYAVPAVGFTVLAGRAARCDSFDVPPTMAPGRYRISKSVDSVPLSLSPVRPRRFVERNLSAEFEVLP